MSEIIVFVKVFESLNFSTKNSHFSPISVTRTIHIESDHVSVAESHILPLSLCDRTRAKNSLAALSYALAMMFRIVAFEMSMIQ